VSGKQTLLLFGIRKVTSMEGSPSWKASGRSDGKEIRRFSRNSKVHCRVHNSPALILISSELRPVPTPHHIVCVSFNRLNAEL